MVGCETTSSGSDIDEFGTAMNYGVNTLYYLDPVTIEEAEKLCEIITIIDKGKVIKTDTKNNLLNLMGTKTVIFELTKFNAIVDSSFCNSYKSPFLVVK